MRKLTVDETWEKCLEMWKWIAERSETIAVRTLKREWLEAHGFGGQVDHDCFFCEKAFQDGGCEYSCPGKKVDRDFSCCTPTYHYKYEPKKFYRKIVELNKVRLEGKMAKLTCSDGTVVQISKETEEELRAAFGEKPKVVAEPAFGDIVECDYGERVVLYDKEGILRACYSYSDGTPRVDVTRLSFYTATGRNIFRGDELKLKV